MFERESSSLFNSKYSLFSQLAGKELQHRCPMFFHQNLSNINNVIRFAQHVLLIARDKLSNRSHVIWQPGLVDTGHWARWERVGWYGVFLRLLGWHFSLLFFPSVRFGFFRFGHFTFETFTLTVFCRFYVSFLRYFSRNRPTVLRFRREHEGKMAESREASEVLLLFVFSNSELYRFAIATSSLR